MNCNKLEWKNDQNGKNNQKEKNNKCDKKLIIFNKNCPEMAFGKNY